MNQAPRCWCGNTDLQPFSAEFLRCAACETLVLRQMPRADVTHVHDDNIDLYGKGYYLSHLQEQYGYPDLQTRARTDLPERCLHWLRTVLKYKLPPGKSLEIGSAHGGFVALMAWAGFDAAGLELSPWLVSLARTTFGVPILLGPVEDQQIEPGSLDAVALMDVLEHLPNPVGTIRRCLDLLGPNGILIVQTPRYPESTSYDEMVTQHDQFLEQLKQEEHLYLFSENSIREFFHRLGAEYLEFELPMFAHYDMFFVASRTPLAVNPPVDAERALSSAPAGRLVQAMLDLDDQVHELKSHSARLEADRAARLEVIKEQGRRLGEVEAERNDLQHELPDLRQQFEFVEADRAARLEVIQKQGQRLGEVEAERNDLQHELADLRQQFEFVEADRAARLEVIQKQGQRLGEVEAERNDLQHEHENCRRQLADLQDQTMIKLLRGARLIRMDRK